MDFKNLYALLKIKPTASQSDIAKAMRQAAQQQTITLDDLKLCKQYLLNEEERTKYDERLFAAHPELLAPPPEPKPEPEPEPEKAEEAKPLAPAKTKQGNKKLYLILAAVVAVIVLIAGTVAYFKHFKPIAEAKEAVRDLLKDPDSAKFYKVEKVLNTHNKEIYVCGEVNAKAPAGGYVGKKPFVYDPMFKEAHIIPITKPNKIKDELFYSVLYQTGCLNADPLVLRDGMEAINTYEKEISSLIEQKRDSDDFVERDNYDVAIARVEEKKDKEVKKLTIYIVDSNESDDD